MHFVRLLICTLVIALTGCSSNLDRSSRFSIDETALNKGTLRIFLPKETPKNLAIKTPNGEWFVVQQPTESIEIMSQAKFETLKVMEFDINVLKGTTWRNGKRISEQIFKSPGQYLVYFADNLETEPENTFVLQKLVTLD